MPVLRRVKITLRGSDSKVSSKQKPIKADREAYLTAIIDEVEKDLQCNWLGSAFKAIKQISGKQTRSNPVSINKADGSPCEYEDEVLLRWKEHYEQALNHSPGTSSVSLDIESSSATADASASTDEPSLSEVTKAIAKLRNGRAPGSDGIAAELLKYAITPVAKALHFLFTRVGKTGHIPADWKDGILVTLYKSKGFVADCSSYRPITLLSIPGKVFAHVLLARIQPLLDATRRPQQSGFVAGRSTIDAILALRLLAEIHREFDRPLNVAFL